MVLGDVEFLQLPQRAKGFLMDLGDLIVYQDQGLKQGRQPRLAPQPPIPLHLPFSLPPELATDGT